MSMYDNNDKDIVYYEIEQFLESHSVAELLDIVADAVRYSQDGDAE